jgi:hypothetical protein
MAPILPFAGRCNRTAPRRSNVPRVGIRPDELLVVSDDLQARGFAAIRWQLKFLEPIHAE